MPASLVDTHAHLVDAAFDGERERVLERARQAGVAAVVCVGESLADARANLELARRFPGMVRPTAGLYPTHLDEAQADELCRLARARRRELVAIGEVGLDRWVIQDEQQREHQRELFHRFIGLARELDLPLNVHSRSAGHHAIAELLDLGAERVQMHAFDGRASRALPAVEAGYFFSVPPSIVRSPQKRKLVARLPLESLLVETDSPVLGPTKDGRNEPANVVVSVDAIAEIKQLPRQQVVEAMIENTRRLYGDLAGAPAEIGFRAPR